MNKYELKQLLDSLTLKEKIGQLFQCSSAYFQEDGVITGLSNSEEGIDEELIKNVGSVLNVFSVQRLRKLQEEHLKFNKIPLIFMSDVIYGFSTIFPIALAQACSFNPQMVKEIARVAATEAAADGINVTFSPMVDISRDARWGRCAESYGEDTLLNSRYAKAMVEGYQGDDLTALDTIGACVKHFAAYGSPYDGKDYNSVEMSERKLRQDYLPSYKAAVDAGALMVMTSFNTIGSIPASIDKFLMKDILRDEWGFDGTIISDWGSIVGSYKEGAANSEEELAKLTMDATVDIDMCDNIYPLYLEKLVSSGQLDIKAIDNSVMRVLELKNKFGLLKDPYRYLKDDDSINKVDYKKHIELAKESVTQSSVLLKNEDNILPLNASSNKVAFIGPYVYSTDHLSQWSKFMPYYKDDISIKQAVEQKFKDNNFDFKRGCPVLRKEEFVDRIPEDECYSNEQKFIDEAIESAKNADVVVMALGEYHLQFGESRSRSEISVPEVQMELFREIHKVNKNIVVVLFNGRPLDIRELNRDAKAILDVWFPGSAGSSAIVNMLFGDAVPSGKLSMSFPQSVGQVPIHYSILPTGHYHPKGITPAFKLRYIDIPNYPLFPFGYGLSYTEFKYDNLRIDKDILNSNSKVTASIDVTNIGESDGYETVQAYIHDCFALYISRPLKQLVDFKKVFIKVGETITVSFEIDESMLRFYNHQMKNESENGEFHLYIGADSNVSDKVSFNLEK